MLQIGEPCPWHHAGMVLFEFSSEKSIQNWQPLNDVVMGGVSSSQMQYIDDGKACFSGTVSPENNGGFASVRYDKTSFDLSDYTGLSLRVKADHKSYQLRLGRSEAIFDVASFLAPEDWTEISLPFSAFYASFRGQNVAAAPFDPSKISSIGLLIADKQLGPFAITIDWIKAYK